MAVVVVKSAAITNRDAKPRVMNSPNLGVGELREEVSLVSVANGDQSTSKYIFHSLPSNARLSSVKLFADDLGTTAAGKIGIYETTENGGAAVSDSFFGSSLDFHTAATSDSEILHKDTVTLAKAEQPLWQQLGLASDPCKWYDVALALTADSDGAGSVVLKTKYVR